MTKFLLTIIMCSSTLGTCLQPYTFLATYPDIYECMMDGYAKALIKTQDVGRKKVNTHQMYIKFICKPVIIPEPKPDAKQPAGKLISLWP